MASIRPRPRSMGKAASSRAPRSWAVVGTAPPQRGRPRQLQNVRPQRGDVACSSARAATHAPRPPRSASGTGLGDGPRAVTTRTSPREPARRATAPRLRDRSGGPRAARAKHAPSTQHATWRASATRCHRSSEMNPLHILLNDISRHSTSTATVLIYMRLMSITTLSVDLLLLAAWHATPQLSHPPRPRYRREIQRADWPPRSGPVG